MQFLLITPVPEIAAFIEECGVSRIFIDMEVMGKYERQANAQTPINSHSFEDAKNVKRALKKAELMIRVNPLHAGTEEEIENSLAAGADVIMLPYFSYPEEVAQFVRLVRGRARTNILLETASASARAEQILSLKGIDEVHFGLNDLRLTYKLDFLFEPFAGGLIEWLCSVAKKHGVSYGIGGIGRVGKEPLPADLVMKEHVRLGSERVILSRVFHKEAKTLDQLKSELDFKAEVDKLLAVAKAAAGRTPQEVESDRQAFIASVNEVARIIREKNQSRSSIAKAA